MWDCASCGCKSIAPGLPSCPQCFKPKEDDMPKATVGGGASNVSAGPGEPGYITPELAEDQAPEVPAGATAEAPAGEVMQTPPGPAQAVTEPAKAPAVPAQAKTEVKDTKTDGKDSDKGA